MYSTTLFIFIPVVANYNIFNYLFVCLRHNYVLCQHSSKTYNDCNNSDPVR